MHAPNAPLGTSILLQERHASKQARQASNRKLRELKAKHGSLLKERHSQDLELQRMDARNSSLLVGGAPAEIKVPPARLPGTAGMLT